jgi:peptidoglycan/xylan/chitin deacetylase (PgdA/CDA1 family)
LTNLNRRQALVTLGAAGFGIVAAATPDVLRTGHVATAAAKGGGGSPHGGGHRVHPSPTPRPEVGYAKNVRGLNPAKPVNTLADLTPPAPANAIALTLDDGPHPKYTPEILDILAEFQVKATFSVIGRQVTEYPAIVQRVVNSGHQISNHTVTHPLDPPLSKLSAKKMQEEIIGCYERIAQVTGGPPKFFRSPGGYWSAGVLETAWAHGMTCLNWAVDPRDWDQPRSTVSHISHTLQAATAGDVLLSHDGGGIRTRTADALRIAIPALKAKGFVFVVP